MDADEPLRPVHWVGSSLKGLRACPEQVKDDVGFALHVAQEGGRHEAAKPLKGFGDAGILEIASHDAGNTYRAIYTVRFAKAVYVLHVFMKKSKRGIKTPQKDIDLVKERLRTATEDYEQRYGGKSHGRKKSRGQR